MLVLSDNAHLQIKMKLLWILLLSNYYYLIKKKKNLIVFFYYGIIIKKKHLQALFVSQLELRVWLQGQCYTSTLVKSSPFYKHDFSKHSIKNEFKWDTWHLILKRVSKPVVTALEALFPFRSLSCFLPGFLH